MPSRPSFFSSSVGSKFLIAFTGLSLVGFLVGHLAGNLLVYVSPDAFNHYGDTLIKNPLVIPAELGLIALFLLHAYKAVRMFLGANDARPVGYQKKARAGHTSRKSWASTTMILSGTFLLLFVPLHLQTFKYGSHYESSEPGVRDLWRTVAEVFSRPGYVVFYVAGMTIIGFHLWHGVSSALQSLGIDRLGWSPALRRIGWTVAAVLAVGFLSIPLYVYFLGARL
ncbi:MAG: succinate dehydrogenase cytochrome b subunit [Vicinamibacteria bacterium]|nr:succinate dehydrogenase cytochrome b subunit [Vicinamibacteria bacterium]